MTYLYPARRFHYLSAFFLLLLVAAPLLAQTSASHTYRALVQDAHHGDPLAGVNVRVEGTEIGGATGPDGRVTIAGIPAGQQTLVFSFVGFETARRTLTFPLANPDEVQVIRLEEAHEEMAEIAVSATRTSRTIADQATRVETIAGEEIDEKITMEPSNLTMLLNESPGITVQQTSAVSGGASIRIQGLDGRYTQLLKDGFPLYGGFSGGLSLLQVPPLDLAQVEVIKGPASTLYGGDAIAGLVNLVSKQPTEVPETSLLANVTSAGGFDLGGFYRARGAHLGMTFLASANFQRAYDPDDDAFSNLPETRRLTLSPRLFYYPAAQTTLSLGVTGTFEEREGGDLDVLADGPTPDRTFFERNTSTRLTTQARLDHTLADWLGGGTHLTLKNSVSVFDRSIEGPDYRFDGIDVLDYRFDGQQIATYSEASLLLDRVAHDLVVGLDLRTDAFREKAPSVVAVRDYTYWSLGAFVQDTWDASDRFLVEAGLRADYHGTFGGFLLPKLSLRYRVTDRLTVRLGGGLGYKAPTVFLEPSEERAFQNVVPLAADVDAETSRGGSFDVNYQTLLFDRLGVSFNQAFYFTDLQDPLVPRIVAFVFDPKPREAALGYENAEGSIQTWALETNAKFSLGAFKLFLGYVHLHTESETDGPLPLTPEHKTYTVLVYEQHGTGRIGLEAYYTGPQTLADGSETEGFWVMGVMAERRFGRARLFLNFENFLDTKQSNYDPVVRGPRNNPRFAEIWAPMDGFIVNGGVKYRL